MKKVAIIIIIATLGTMLAYGQDRKPWPLRALRSIGNYIDSATVRGIDKRYLEVPERPWQVVLKYNVNDMELISTSGIDQEQMAQRGINGDVTFESRFLPSASVSVGAWVGYRGYGLGYSFSLTRSNGSNFSIGAMGANYGFNLRLRSFSTNELGASMWGHENGIDFDAPIENIETLDDIHVKTAIFDAFYLFNGKRFSYCAAYDQSVKQIKSAGSLMAGIMWFQTSLNYANKLNALLIQVLGNTGRMTIQEGSIGVGYAYNWVPAKNLLINAMVMPMVALYNRTKTYQYDSNYDIFLEEGEPSPRGKKVVPYDGSWKDDVTLEQTGSEVSYGKVSLNIDARMSITYNLDPFFLTVSGKWNHFRNKVAGVSLRLSDWYLNGSLGIRL